MDKTMQYTDDELLSAFIDGELPQDEIAALNLRLEKEPALAKRLDAMRRSDEALQKVYAAIDDTPVPDAVMQLFDRQMASQERDNVVQFPLRGLRRYLQAPVAIAASVALIAGFLVGDLTRRDASTSIESLSLTAGAVNNRSTLHEMLEYGVGGDAQDLGNGETAQLLLTFEDTAGDYCRQLRIEAAERSSHGVACRRDDAWQMEIIALGAATPGGQFATAAGTTPEVVERAVDALIGSGEPLESSEEIRLISNGWKKTAE